MPIADSIPVPAVGRVPQRGPADLDSARSTRTPYVVCLLLGLGGLFTGVTGPLLSNFVPILVRDGLGDARTAIGGVMAIDNVLLLLLVPLAGAASDRSSARGRGRLPLVLFGFLLAAAGMALFPFAAAFGIAGLVGVMLVLYTGINVQRSPFHALLADGVPSAYRSVATGSFTFQMCVAAILFLMLGRILGMRPAFLIAAGTVIAIAGALALWVREPAASQTHAEEATFGTLAEAWWSTVRGDVVGLRAIFIASLLLQLTFQTFTTWFSLHGTERFGVSAEAVSIGMIAWALGGAIGALPAGFLGVRIGRRHAMLLGFALMAASLLALHRVSSLAVATALLAVASASWTLPTVNAYPLFVERIPRERRGVLAALFLLSTALGGAIGDPLNGGLFDLFGGYRPLFLLMTMYTALAFGAVLLVPRGAGEANTGA
jgi:maltose/moltooligosaccharide transporter